MDDNELTAKAWIVFNNANREYIKGYNTLHKYEIASLTKMYTLYACLLLNHSLNIQPKMCNVQVVPSTNVGTLANLQIGRFLTLQDLYYGLMLPSGNDAALVLAYYYGYWLERTDKFPSFQWKKVASFTLKGRQKYNKIYLSRFMNYVNTYLIKEKLNHKQTNLQNPHGLPDKFQHSNAWEIANAVLLFLQHPKFALIAKTAKYRSEYEDGQQIEWENTNILLKEGYMGIKTGHTVTAGNCLCSRRIVEVKGRVYDLVIVILGCKTLERRFTETKDLVEGLINYLKHY